MPCAELLHINRDNCIKEIEFTLYLIDVLIESRSKHAQYDVNIEAEDFFIHYLNILHKWSLKNTNVTRKNYPAIDAGDKQNHIALQISSKQDNTKFSQTLRNFIKNGFYEQYDHLYVLGLGNKPKRDLHLAKTFVASETDPGSNKETKQFSFDFPISITNAHNISIPIPRSILQTSTTFSVTYAQIIEHLNHNFSNSSQPKDRYDENDESLNHLAIITKDIEEFIEPYKNWPEGFYITVTDVLNATKSFDDAVIQELSTYVIEHVSMLSNYIPDRILKRLQQSSDLSIQAFINKFLEQQTVGRIPSSENPNLIYYPDSVHSAESKKLTEYTVQPDIFCYSPQKLKKDQYLIDITPISEQSPTVAQPSTLSLCSIYSLMRPYISLSEDEFINALVPKNILHELRLSGYSDASIFYNHISGTIAENFIESFRDDQEYDAIHSFTGCASRFLREPHISIMNFLSCAMALFSTYPNDRVKNFFLSQTENPVHSDVKKGLAILVLYALFSDKYFFELIPSLKRAWKG